MHLHDVGDCCKEGLRMTAQIGDIYINIKRKSSPSWLYLL